MTAPFRGPRPGAAFAAGAGVDQPSEEDLIVMTAELHIPDEAVARSVELDWDGTSPPDTRLALRRAAPLVVAAELRRLSDALLDHRDAIRHLRSAGERMAGIEESAGWLRRRADELEGGQS